MLVIFWNSYIQWRMKVCYFKMSFAEWLHVRLHFSSCVLISQARPEKSGLASETSCVPGRIAAQCSLAWPDRFFPFIFGREKGSG